MKWIKCSDQLPEIDKEILIYDEGIYIGFTYDINKEARDKSKSKNLMKKYPIIVGYSIECLCAHGRYAEIIEPSLSVTHWMPLPSMPAQDDQ